MPIRPPLKGQKFDRETIRVMGLGFEIPLAALRLADLFDLANEILAHFLSLQKRVSAIPNDCAKAMMEESRRPPPHL